MGKTYGDALNTIEVPAFTLVGAGVHCDLGAANQEWQGGQDQCHGEEAAIIGC